jgi:hypothetical protein
MSDFVERLRKEIKFSQPHNTVHIDLLGEAADRIEALEAALRLCVIELRQMSFDVGDSTWRALNKSRVALAEEQDK